MRFFFDYIHEIRFLLDKEAHKVIPVIFIIIFASLFELLGLSLIGAYGAIILDSSSFRLFLSNYSSLEYLNSFTDVDLILFLGVVLLLSFLMKFICLLISFYQIFKFSAMQQLKLQKRLMKYLLEQDYEEFIQSKTGEALASITNFTRTYEQVLRSSLDLLSNFLVVVSVIFILAFVSFKSLAALFISVGLFLFIFNFLFGAKIKQYGEDFLNGVTRMTKGVSETLLGLKEIKTLNKEMFFRKSFDEGAEALANSQFKLNVFSIIPRNLIEVILIAFLVSLVGVTIYMDGDLAEVLVILGVFVAATIRITPMISQIQVSLNNLAFGREPISSLYKDLLTRREISSSSNLSKNPNLLQEKEAFKEIILKGVTYSYPNSSENSLNDISLKIERGDYLGFVGPSGAGKTTLIDVLLGLLRPSKGTIEFNGKDIQSDLQSWRAFIAYLPQEIFLIDDSIEQNILLGEEIIDGTKNKLKDSISSSMLDKFISTLPEKMDTRLGDRGVRLSGGQRQRVALARALFHEREILVLDESTSSLDAKTEDEIIQQLLSIKGQRTIISISHRIGTLKNCDRIYRLENGKISEPMDYKDLLKQAEAIDLEI